MNAGRLQRWLKSLNATEGKLLFCDADRTRYVALFRLEQTGLSLVYRVFGTTQTKGPFTWGFEYLDEFGPSAKGASLPPSKPCFEKLQTRVSWNVVDGYQGKISVMAKWGDTTRFSGELELREDTWIILCTNRF